MNTDSGNENEQHPATDHSLDESMDTEASQDTITAEEEPSADGEELPAEVAQLSDEEFESATSQSDHSSLYEDPHLEEESPEEDADSSFDEDEPVGPSTSRRMTLRARGPANRRGVGAAPRAGGRILRDGPQLSRRERERRRLRSTTKLLLPRATFLRILRKEEREIQEKRNNAPPHRFSAGAVDAMREDFEAFALKLLTASQWTAGHARRKRVAWKDWCHVRKILDLFDVETY